MQISSLQSFNSIEIKNNRADFRLLDYLDLNMTDASHSWYVKACAIYD